MSEYQNIPIERSGPDIFLHTKKLPDKYQVLSGRNMGKEHICLHYNVSEYSSYTRGEAFCGYIIGSGEIVEQESIYPCETCLNILNKEMEGYLYDEVEKEYYDPR